MSTGKSQRKEFTLLLKSSGVIGLATFLSRILGFIRDIVIARLFGVYALAQAFVVAFKIPNLFRDLLGEGAANAAFVPVFSEYNATKSKEEFWELANVVLNILLVVLSALTICGVVFSGVIVRLIAPGFIADPEKLALTVRLTRIIFPYILLVSLAAYAMGILNSLRHFFFPALAPCLLNISIIAFALLFGEGIKGLAFGVLVGGALQLAVQLPVLYRKGLRLRLFRSFSHPQARRIGRLMAPRLLSSSVYQLNNFIDSVFASLVFIVGEGALAVLYFAYRLIQFPIGVFSNSLAQAALPAFSEQALEPDKENLKRSFSFSLRMLFLVMLPASIAFMVLPRLIVHSLFSGGRFDSYSVETTAGALFFYSIGLSAYGAIKIMHSCFFALKDTLTPAKISFLALLLNIALNALLMFPLKLNGLALATSLSGIGSSLILFSALNKKIGGIPLKPILNSFLRILAASLSMGAVCFLLSRNSLSAGGTLFARSLNLGVVLISGIASYIIFCALFRVREAEDLLSWLSGGKKA